LVVGVFLICFSSNVADFISEKTKVNSWEIGTNLYRFNFLLLLIALRDEVKLLIGLVGYRIICYLLINHFVDRYLGYNSWSWNDVLTVIIVFVEFLIHKKNNKI
jgi:hypothetical protein